MQRKSLKLLVFLLFLGCGSGTEVVADKAPTPEPTATPAVATGPYETCVCYRNMIDSYRKCFEGTATADEYQTCINNSFIACFLCMNQAENMEICSGELRNYCPWF